MNTLSKVLDALTLGGADSALDVLLKLCVIAITGVMFVAGMVLLAGAVQ